MTPMEPLFGETSPISGAKPLSSKGVKTMGEGFADVFTSEDISEGAETDADDGASAPLLALFGPLATDLARTVAATAKTGDGFGAPILQDIGKTAPRAVEIGASLTAAAAPPTSEAGALAAAKVGTSAPSESAPAMLPSQPAMKPLSAGLGDAAAMPDASKMDDGFMPLRDAAKAVREPMAATASADSMAKTMPPSVGGAPSKPMPTALADSVGMPSTGAVETRAIRGQESDAIDHPRKAAKPLIDVETSALSSVKSNVARPVAAEAAASPLAAKTMPEAERLQRAGVVETEAQLEPRLGADRSGVELAGTVRRAEPWTGAPSPVAAWAANATAQRDGLEGGRREAARVVVATSSPADLVETTGHGALQGGANAPAASGQGAGAQLNPAPAAAQAMAEHARLAVKQGLDGTTELRLDPPELGRVRLTLTHGEHHITAVITADRPEVADLMRRHADMLSQSLADAGHARVDLRFSGGGSGGQGLASGSEGGGDPTDSPVEEAAAPAAGPRDGLDLRV